MSVKKVLKHLLTSGLTNDAQLLYMYMRFMTPGGVGQAGAHRFFKDQDVDVDDAWEILEEAELIGPVKGGGRHKALDIVHVEAVTALVEGEELPDDAPFTLYQKYQTWRETSGYSKETAQYKRGKWAPLLSFLERKRIEPLEWFQFVAQVFKEYGYHEMPPGRNITGPHAREKWEEKAGTGQRGRTGHAGASYAATGGVRVRLMRKGVDIDDFTPADLRFINDLAGQVAVDPDTHIPPKYKQAVEALC